MATAPAPSGCASTDLISSITQEVQLYFKNPNFDSSHDFDHVRRVLALAKAILYKEQPPFYDETVVILAALLHDVDDHKYHIEGDVVTAKSLLLKHGANPDLAEKVQSIVSGVSYTHEVKDPQRVKDLIAQIPEVAIVQDADRLDAIGAIGVGRCFTYGGAKNRSLDATIGHFDVKLVKLQGMMKTGTGQRMAFERTERLKMFMQWWKQEAAILEEV